MKFPKEVYDKYPSLRKFEIDGYKEWKGGRERALLEHVKQSPDFTQMEGNPAKLLEAMDEFAVQQDFLINIGSDKGRILTDLLAEERPKVVVELGTYVGYSAIMLANQMRHFNKQGEAVKLWSLEFDSELANIASEFINIAGLSDVVTVVTGAASESLRTLKAGGRLDHADLIFLDHVENLYVQDLTVCEELGLLKTGVCIVADNVLMPGAPEYRQYVRSHPKLKSWGVKGLIMPGEFEDEMEVSKVL
ncbi:S-adenosyl-L-methionine-dependent methyltransferase [Lojkania enalia]|uniref:catechol O-methyltransferase n=1 Tax=Lojkania enalia TaxID=147567 RepID=A0A9P4N0B3_9PLEO|nr:S-adenosyl-L-methionine-dependent methyltransferase [Didymosphaeria enalia]